MYTSYMRRDATKFWNARSEPGRYMSILYKACFKMGIIIPYRVVKYDNDGRHHIILRTLFLTYAHSFFIYITRFAFYKSSIRNYVAGEK